MEKSKPITISELDVEPISDEELRSIVGQGRLAASSDPGECCDWAPNSEFVCPDQIT